MLSAVAMAQHEGEGDQHQHDCPPDHANCHVPTGEPSPRPTPAPTTPQPTFVYTIDFKDTKETKIWPADGTSMDYYGFATAIHHRTAVVGAYGSKDGGEGAGAIYVYSTNATDFPYYEDGTTPWTFDQKIVYEKYEEHCNKDGCEYKKDEHAAENGQFGYAVAVWDDVIVVGAHRHEEHHAGGGQAYVYNRQGFHGPWTLTQTIAPEDGHEYHYFGYSASIYDQTIVLGAAGDNHNGVSAGAVYVFDYDESYNAWFEVAKLTSTNGEAFDNFGNAVDVYKKFIVVGASGDETNGADSGAAYVFVKFGQWVQEGKLTPSDAEAKAYFGHSVSLYEDTLIVGAYQAHGHWDYAGACYVYVVDVDGIWNFQAKLIAHDGMSEDKFGWDVAVYKDTVVVGAYGEMAKQQEQPPGGHRALQPANNNNQGPEHGENCGPNSGPDCNKYEGEYSYRGASTGSVYVFARSGSTWLQEFKLIANGSAAYDSFGKSVSIHENVLFIGADMADGVAENTGAAYIYAPPTMSPSNKPKQSSNSYFDSDAATYGGGGLLFLVIIGAVAGLLYYATANKKDPRQQHLPVSTDSQHGSNTPWSMHGAFDDSSRGPVGRAPVNTTRSPLRGPPVARGL